MSTQKKVSLPLSLASVVLMRDQKQCQYCLSWPGVDVQIDHVLASSLGGVSETYNLVASCRKCNSRKSQAIWLPKNWLEITDGHEEYRDEVLGCSLSPYNPHDIPFAGYFGSCVTIETFKRLTGQDYIIGVS